MKLIKKYLAEAKKPKNFTILIIYPLLLLSVIANSLGLAIILTGFLVVSLITQKNIILGFYLGVLSISFDQVFIPTFFSLKLHMLVFLSVFISLGFYFIKERKLPPLPQKSLTIPLVGVLMFSAISIIGAVDRTIAVRFLGALVYAIAVFLITYALISDRGKAVKTVSALFIGVLVSSIIAIYQFIAFYLGIDFYKKITILNPGNFARPKGIFDHTNFFANFLLGSIPIGLAFSLWEKNRSLVKLAALGISTGALIITLSRAAFAGFFLSLLIILYFAFKYKLFPLALNRSLNVAIMSITVVTVLFFLIGPFRQEFVPIGGTDSKPQGSLVTNRITSSIDPQAVTNTERIQIWAAGVGMLSDNFVFGVGLENFKVKYKEYKLPEAKRDQVAAHNSYFQLLIETGMFGFVSFVVFWIFLFTSAVRGVIKSRDIVLRSLLIGGVAALVGVSLQNLTNSVFYSTHLWFLYGFVAALTRLNLSKK